MKYLLISWLWCYFEPLQDYLYRLATQGKIHNKVFDLLTCWKCMSFWLTLLFTLNIYLAILNSLIAWLLVNLTSK